MKLFVYGTLKSGHYNNRLLLRSTLLGEGVTKDTYLLYNRGFPVAVASQSAKALPVRGEVWEVDEDIISIDRLEGHPNWYQRQEVKVDVNGEELIAWMYLQPNSLGDSLCNSLNNVYYWD